MDLPSPKTGYMEMEAARFWGYQLGEWKQESTANRARAMAHYIHHTMRSSYSSEKAMEKSSGKKDQRDSYNDLMRSMGLMQ